MNFSINVAVYSRVVVSNLARVYLLVYPDYTLKLAFISELGKEGKALFIASLQVLHTFVLYTYRQLFPVSVFL